VAIYTGQIAAALAAGNTVLAKPAEDASAIALAVTALFHEALHEAGFPEDVLFCIPVTGQQWRSRCCLMIELPVLSLPVQAKWQTGLPPACHNALAPYPP
jgi:hypothetical protein